METQSNRRVLTVLLIIFLLCRAETAFAISVNDWLKLNQPAQIVYITGVMDVWDEEVTVCKNKEYISLGKELELGGLCDRAKLFYEPVVLCIRNILRTQIWAIVEKYVKDNPEEWETSMSGYVWLALRKACDKKIP